MPTRPPSLDEIWPTNWRVEPSYGEFQRIRSLDTGRFREGLVDRGHRLLRQDAPEQGGVAACVERLLVCATTRTLVPGPDKR
jgi:hypothetical protein